MSCVLLKEPRVEQLVDVLTEEEENRLKAQVRATKLQSQDENIRIDDERSYTGIVDRCISRLSLRMRGVAPLHVEECFLVCSDAMSSLSWLDHKRVLDRGVNLTFNIALTEDGEYDGGDLVVKGSRRWRIQHQHRSALVHCSSVRHGVVPVTRGKCIYLIARLTSRSVFRFWTCGLNDALKYSIAQYLNMQECCSLAAGSKQELEVIDTIWPSFLTHRGRSSVIRAICHEEALEYQWCAARRRRISKAMQVPLNEYQIREYTIFRYRLHSRIVRRIADLFLRDAAASAEIDDAISTDSDRSLSISVEGEEGQSEDVKIAAARHTDGVLESTSLVRPHHLRLERRR